MSLLYQIALTLLPGVGDITGKKLVSYCGGVEAVFTEKYHRLLKIPGIGELTAKAIANQNVFSRAEEEAVFIEKYRITPLFYLDTDYPRRLKNCIDSPMMLYYKGNTNLNNTRAISIVGTRKATNYGKDFTERLIRELIPYNVLIVSGLAFGIDTCAHKAALECGLATIGVLGHGLDRIYPVQNRSLAGKMVEHGGLLTDFPSQTNPDRENFPKRNRIIAGASDATIVIETGLRGGSLITADIANSYNRDVYALPGRSGDEHSIGCNWLVKTNRAALCDTPEDIISNLGWELNEKPTSGKKQRELFIELTEDEEKIVSVLKANGDVAVDQMSEATSLPASKLAAALLNLEFEGLLKCMPGKVYRLI
jgi:DNA processing protein